MYDGFNEEYVYGYHLIKKHSYIKEDFILSFNFRKVNLIPDTIPQHGHIKILDSSNNTLFLFMYNQDLGGTNEGLKYYNKTDLLLYNIDVKEIWHKIKFHVYLSDSTYDLYYDNILIDSNLGFFTNWNGRPINILRFFSDGVSLIKMYFDDFSLSSMEEPLTIKVKEYPLYNYDFENEYVTNQDENITFVDSTLFSFETDSHFTINYDYERIGWGDKKLKCYREEIEWSEIKHNIYSYTKILSDFCYSFDFCQDSYLSGSKGALNQLTRFTIENNYGYVISQIMFYSNSTWRGFNIFETYYNTYIAYPYRDNIYYNIKIYQYISQEIYHIFINDEFLYTASTRDTYYGDYVGYLMIDNIQSGTEYYFWFDNFKINSLTMPLSIYTINPTLIESMLYMFIIFFILYIPSIAINKTDFDDEIKQKINLLSILFMGIILVSVGLIAIWNMLVLVICFIAIAIEEVN